jgi:DNA-binding transcriptional MerR regulator
MCDQKDLSSINQEGRVYFSIGEVAGMLGENQSLIRFWEKHFSGITPKRNRKGNRIYTQAQITRLKSIHYLVKSKGLTLQGARDALTRSPEEVDKETTLREHILRIRGHLLQLRDALED